MAALEKRILSALRSHKRQGLTRRELAKKVGLKQKQKASFDQAVQLLVEQDELVERDGRLFPVEGQNLVPGEVVKVSGNFGFARPDGMEKDVFIPGKMLMGAMPGDRVMLRLRPGRGGQLDEGEVFSIRQANDKPFSGVLRLEQGAYAVLPDHNSRFPLPVVRGGLMGAKPGDKVLAEIASRGARHSEHTVRVVNTFGSSLSPAACAQAVLADLRIPIAFPDEVKEQAGAIAAGHGIHPKEIAARTDLRDQIIFTIDGADSKDLDDAISLTRLAGGWELGVHIADVSHYVTHRSPLDEEAFRRGTSVYYADSVIPMLPEELSNGICSLNPGEDRLTFSALIRLDSTGKMSGYRFEKSVIRSRVKGVYTELNSLLENAGDADLMEKYAQVWDTLLDMKELAQLLIRNRQAAGKLDLESTESKIILDAGGEPVDIVPRKRGFCERLIEEFMLLANEAAATLAAKAELPFVYRVHDTPSPEKLEQLYLVLTKLGIPFKKPAQSALSKGLADILHQVEGTPYAGVIGTLVLRSMAKARYAEENTGHFGLSTEHYAHFTSPIRRYPDLSIHRILTAHLSPMKRENLHRRFTPFAARSAEHSTQREIAAVQAERGCEDCYKAAYMDRFVGEEFQGVVSGCTPHGIYVQLANTCEGLVRTTAFPQGDWAFDGQIAFLGSLGNRIQLGDSVKVRVLSANVSAGQVDFALI